MSRIAACTLLLVLKGMMTAEHNKKGEITTENSTCATFSLQHHVGEVKNFGPPTAAAYLSLKGASYINANSDELCRATNGSLTVLRGLLTAN